MSERERVKERAPGFKGQKSALPLESYGIAEAEQIENFFLRNNQLNKISGNTTYQEVLQTSTEGGVNSLNVIKDILFAQRGKDLAFAQVPPNYPAPASYFFTDITAGILGSTKRLFSATWRDRIAFSNTQDAFCAFYNDAGFSLSTNLNSFGIDPGTRATWSDNSILSSGAAGSIENGYHHYMVALYDQNTNTESVCSGALAGVDGLVDPSPNGFFGPVTLNINVDGSHKVNINRASLLAHIKSSPSYTALTGRPTHFIVYRTKTNVGAALTAPNFTSFFRVPMDGGTYGGSTIIPIAGFEATLSDFIDNTTDAAIVAVSPPTNNSPPPTPARMLRALTQAQTTYTAGETWTTTDYSGFRHMRFFRDQLFGVGGHSYGFTISGGTNSDVSTSDNTKQKFTGRVTQFRDLLHGSEVYQPDYWPYRWEIGRGDGQETIGIGVLGDVALLIFKEGSTYYLAGSSPDNFAVRIMDTDKGCVHQGTIQETPFGVVTLDKSGFVLWDKIGQGTKISEDIFDQIQNIQFIYADKFYSCYDSKKALYRCSVATAGGAGNPNFTFILDLHTMQWTTERGTEGLSRINFSINTNNLSATSGTAIDVGKIYDFVGSTFNGRILDYSDPAQVTNNGAPIVSTWKSGTLNFGDDQHKKRMKWLYLRAKANSAWTVDIDIIPDYDESRKFTLTDWNVVASQSLWYASDLTGGTLLWDDGTGNAGGLWASDSVSRFVSKIPISCVGFTFQVRIVHKSVDPAQSQFAIESLSAEAVQLGR